MSRRVVTERSRAGKQRDAGGTGPASPAVQAAAREHSPTERELVIQKARFEQLFENTPLAILMGDSQDHVVSINPAFEQLFGFDRQEVVGRSINELIAPNGYEEEASKLSCSVLNGEQVQYESVRRRKDGSLVEVEIFGVPVILDAKPEGVYAIYVDMSERRRAERVIRESEERFRSLAEQSLQGIFVLSGGRIVYANPMMAEICGYTCEEMAAWRPREYERIIHASDRASVLSVIDAIVDGKKITRTQLEYRINTKHGSLRWVLQQTQLISFNGGQGVQGILVDITKRRLAEEQLRHTALHDSLTGLPNRLLLFDRIELALERAKADAGNRFAVLALDLDRFKVINDSLGHMAGDMLLMQTARRLEQVIRPGDTVARLGGDEFAVQVNNVRHATEAALIAERIQRALKEPFALGSQEVFSSASIGIALSSCAYESPDEILRDADIAVSRAKARGPAHHEIFNQEMHTRAVSLQRLETDLRRAIERRELFLHYQPIVSLQEGQRLLAFEALLRWQHPDRGLMLPDAFIHLAEETGLIIPIGEWVLDEACSQLRRWERSHNGAAIPSLSVNLFSRQFSQPELVSLVAGIVAETGIEPAHLNLEITESAVIEDPERAVQVLGELRDLDVRISLDDFGTGYSSLAYLQRFAVDMLKIDRSFIRKIGEDGSGAEIVEAIITLAHKLGMEALGEGIETEAQRRYLTKLGCEYGQGFLFSAALPADAASRLLKQQNHEP